MPNIVFRGDLAPGWHPDLLPQEQLEARDGQGFQDPVLLRDLLNDVPAQGRQVLQVRIEHWGPLPQPQPSTAVNSDSTVQSAASFLIPMAERFAAGLLADAKA